VRISVDVDAGPAQRALAALRAKAADLAPVFRGIGADIVADAALRFRDSRDPYGVPWKPLAASTIRRRRKGSSKPLLDTGRLRNSVSYRLIGNGVEVGSNVEYAAIHQFGGTIAFAPRSFKVRLRRVGGRTRFAKDKHKRGVTEKWGTNARGWSVTIPARPYIATRARGLPREYGEIIRDQLARHFGRIVA
jgi:phage virion morphogenesis protein